MSRSIAVLGLGKFGRSLAESLYSLGMDLMVVDRDPDLIREFSAKSTVAVCANLENEEEIRTGSVNLHPNPRSRSARIWKTKRRSRSWT